MKKILAVLIFFTLSSFQNAYSGNEDLLEGVDKEYLKYYSDIDENYNVIFSIIEKNIAEVEADYNKLKVDYDPFALARNDLFNKIKNNKDLIVKKQEELDKSKVQADQEKLKLEIANLNKDIKSTQDKIEKLNKDNKVLESQFNETSNMLKSKKNISADLKYYAKQFVLAHEDLLSTYFTYQGTKKPEDLTKLDIAKNKFYDIGFIIRSDVLFFNKDRSTEIEKNVGSILSNFYIRKNVVQTLKNEASDFSKLVASKISEYKARAEVMATFMKEKEDLIAQFDSGKKMDNKTIETVSRTKTEIIKLRIDIKKANNNINFLLAADAKSQNYLVNISNIYSYLTKIEKDYINSILLSDDINKVNSQDTKNKYMEVLGFESKFDVYVKEFRELLKLPTDQKIGDDLSPYEYTLIFSEEMRQRKWLSDFRFYLLSKSFDIETREAYLDNKSGLSDQDKNDKKALIESAYLNKNLIGIDWNLHLNDKIVDKPIEGVTTSLRINLLMQKISDLNQDFSIKSYIDFGYQFYPMDKMLINPSLTVSKDLNTNEFVRFGLRNKLESVNLTESFDMGLELYGEYLPPIYNIFNDSIPKSSSNFKVWEINTSAEVYFIFFKNIKLDFFGTLGLSNHQYIAKEGYIVKDDFSTTTVLKDFNECNNWSFKTTLFIDALMIGYELKNSPEDIQYISKDNRKIPIDNGFTIGVNFNF